MYSLAANLQTLSKSVQGMFAYWRNEAKNTKGDHGRGRMAQGLREEPCCAGFDV
jgi:hypothetical protein